MTVEHALSCKTGGLVHIRHDDVADEWRHHEKEKKDKYLQNCLEMRKDFTPMAYSVDGIAAQEAWNAEKRLATHLASKWNR